MKKILCIVISALTLTMCYFTAEASENYLVLGGFSFDINDNGKAVIHEYDDRSADVVIPDKLLGAKVVEIDSYAFFGDSVITSVSFASASELCSIGDLAFCGCSSLTELSLPSGINLSFASFQNCTGLTSVTLGEDISAIPSQCFNGCSSLNKVEIPSTVTEIGERAFDGCSNLVIYCKKSSYAFDYAQANNISYRLTDSTGYIRGDADCDGEVIINDATAIQKVLAELPVPAFNLSAADVDGNGLDISDVTSIQRHIALLYDPFHIGETVE